MIPAHALARSLAAWTLNFPEGCTPAPNPPDGSGSSGLPANHAEPPRRAAGAERAAALPASRTYAERLRDGDARRPPWSQSDARSSAHAAGLPPWRARSAGGALIAAAASGRGGSRAPGGSEPWAAAHRRGSLAALAQLPSGAGQRLQLTQHPCRSCTGTSAPAVSAADAAHAALRLSADDEPARGFAVPQHMLRRLGAPARGVEAAVAAAAGAVVAVVGPDGAWASAVAATSAFLVTNAHVLQASRRAGGRVPDPRAESAPGFRAGRARQQESVYPDMRREPAQGRVRVRLPGGAWRSAAVVYVFQGPLDLAVLALLPDGLAGSARAAGSPGPALASGTLRPAALCAGASEPGEPLAVLGHALLHPRAPLDAGVTAGVLARVVCSSAVLPAASGAAAAGEGALDAGGPGAEPAMLLTTAPVYPGAAFACACGLHAPSPPAWLPKHTTRMRSCSSCRQSPASDDLALALAAAALPTRAMSLRARGRRERRRGGERMRPPGGPGDVQLAPRGDRRAAARPQLLRRGRRAQAAVGDPGGGALRQRGARPGT